MKNRVFRLTVREEDRGLRIDQVLPLLSDELSRSHSRKLIDIGGVHLDGRRVSQCSRVVAPGQRIEVYVDGLNLEAWELRPEHILFQDDYLLALNKPAGIDTQPTPARFKGTVYHALTRYLQQQKPGKPVSLGMVQRLDRGTSGVMVFSIHPAAHKGLTAAISERQADKRYLALVEGDVRDDRGEIRSLLARNRASNLVKSVARGGKEAITRYRVYQRLAGATLLEVQLLTGRSHQIRAHFSEAGHPLLGDVRYGGRERAFDHDFSFPMLHSWQLRLQHPRSGEKLELTASPGDIWERCWQAMGIELFPWDAQEKGAAPAINSDNDRSR